MNIHLLLGDGSMRIPGVLIADPNSDRYVTVRVGDSYFRFHRATGKAAGSPTDRSNPYAIPRDELARIA
jgi:hypothetical protein